MEKIDSRQHHDKTQQSLTLDGGLVVSGRLIIISRDSRDFAIYVAYVILGQVT